MDNTNVIFTVKLYFMVHLLNKSQIYLTLIELPIMDSRSTAFVMIWTRFGGAFRVRSKFSVIPPVKSSIASQLEPPFRFSYEPFILTTAM